MTTATSGDDMSSGAASRARELLAAKQSESFLNFKPPAASPPNNDVHTHPQAPIRTTGQINVRVETMTESSSRLKDILSTMRQKRETLSSTVQDSKTKGETASPERSVSASPPRGKPPRFAVTAEREELTKKMNDSLRHRRDRITRLSSVDRQKQRVSSKSPHTVDTATTEDSTTEDSQSIGSWAAERTTPQYLVEESTKSSTPLREIEESAENEDSSIVERNHVDSSTEEDGPSATSPESHADLFIPIDSSESGTGQFSPTVSVEEDNTDRFGSAEGSERTERSQGTQGDKKVSFDDTLCVIEEMLPPSVVHCNTSSFESPHLKERFIPGYSQDDSSYSVGATASDSTVRDLLCNLKRTSSWDGSDVDASEARKNRYSFLVNDRDKRVLLMRKLEQTYSELLGLHTQIESTTNQETTNRDDSSDSSMEILENDDDSSAEFTNDSNTSGWDSRDESNSRLDSLLQYMTSEDDDSFQESLTSQERFSISISHTASNLDTLMESDETEEAEGPTEPDKSSESEDKNTENKSCPVDSSVASRDGLAATKQCPRVSEVTPSGSTASNSTNKEEESKELDTTHLGCHCEGEARAEYVTDADTTVLNSGGEKSTESEACTGDDQEDNTHEDFDDSAQERKEAAKAISRHGNQARDRRGHAEEPMGTHSLSGVAFVNSSDMDDSSRKYEARERRAHAKDPVGVRNLSSVVSNETENETRDRRKHAKDPVGVRNLSRAVSLETENEARDTRAHAEGPAGTRRLSSVASVEITSGEDAAQENKAQFRREHAKDPAGTRNLSSTATVEIASSEYNARYSSDSKRKCDRRPKENMTQEPNAESIGNEEKKVISKASKDSEDTSGGRSSTKSSKNKKISKKPSVDSKDSKRSADSKRKRKIAKKPSLKSRGDPRMINKVIIVNKRSPKGIVKREIDRWESAQGNPKETRSDPDRPDPPVGEISFLVEPHDEEMTEDEFDETELGHEDKREDPMGEDPLRVDSMTENLKKEDPSTEDPGTPEAEMDVSDEVKITETAEIPDEDKNIERPKRKCLFVSRKISNMRCRANGGLFDLAKKTGISDSSTIYVTSLDMPRPPELTAINAEFACGAQGSLYDLALRSGCKIEQPPEPKRLKLPPLGGGKRRWLLKTRGGHYHISVWTTISNAVLAARVGFSTNSAKGLKSTIHEQRSDNHCGARGLKHIVETTDWF